MILPAPIRLLPIAALAFIPLVAHAQDGWPLFRADAQRSGMASKLPPWEKRPAWQRPLLLDKYEGNPDPDPDQAAKALIDRLRKNADPTILPGFFPLLLKDSCIYRGHRDVRCVTFKELREKDGFTGKIIVTTPGGVVWQSVPTFPTLSVSLEGIELKFGVHQLSDLLEQSKQSHYLWANAMTGTISADEQLVYAIHDLPIPTAQAKNDKKRVSLVRLANRFGGQNMLTAFDVVSGKFVWDINHTEDAALPPFKGSYFLGAPLPLEKKIYLLNEGAGELRLMVVDPDPKKWQWKAPAPLEKSLPLLQVAEAEQAGNHLLRRTQPLHLAHADGLLVCPSHAGVLFGVDRAKMAIRWQYRYRAEKVAAPPLPLWQAACPIIHKERIVFTAADAPEIHCLDLKGKKQWAVAADKDLYLAAVHDDIVLLVGKSGCRALKLADGTEKWKLEMGLPAGVGVQDGSLYYLPLKRDAMTDGPTLWAIDLAKGKKTRRIDVPHPDALGNLILHRGMIVSQSVTHIAAFPAQKP